MKKIEKNWAFALLTGAGLALSQSGEAAEQIIVYATDTSAGTAPPPATTATLNSSSSLDFGTNSFVVFSNVTAGTHSISVSTTTSGYLPRQSVETAGTLNNPDSAYGNPRNVTVAEDEAASLTFRFDPAVSVSATVRDAWTMERLQDTAIEFIVNSGPNSDLVYSNFPWGADYASIWQSDASGVFPSNTFLYVDPYDLEITCTGYQTYVSSNVITNASVGDEFDLGVILLTPVDSNSNQIADVWETLYFGTGSNVTASADPDEDNSSNMDEYIAGTEPTNSASVLTLSHSISNSTMELTWNTEPDRTYRIIGTIDLVTGTWVQVSGPWEASSNQTEMSWVETNMDLSWHNSYCVDVVPCTWTGTNQILVYTNDWPTGGGGGSTNGPPTP